MKQYVIPLIALCLACFALAHAAKTAEQLKQLREFYKVESDYIQELHEGAVKRGYGEIIEHPRDPGDDRSYEFRWK